MAIGNANAEIIRDKVKIYVNGIQIAEDGKSISFHYQSVLSALDKFQIDIEIDLVFIIKIFPKLLKIIFCFY